MRTPRGFLRYQVAVLGCRCTTEAERLICGADLLRKLWGPIRELPPIPSEYYGEFQIWLNQLTVDFHLAPKRLVFCAIMEEWDRKKILQALRREECTQL